ncbi:hypothetical protein RIF29_00787 [Crotalaria pallida]|uniref:FORGETTER1 second zinc ribbon domain-containing protein n=1 Tax=Crotalaria pallida TaxID=3830 RepID=A0AAN9P798_CROPI
MPQMLPPIRSSWPGFTTPLLHRIPLLLLLLPPPPPSSSSSSSSHILAHGIDPTKIQLPCAKCKAILNVPHGLARFTCPQCGIELSVDVSKVKQFFPPEEVNEVQFLLLSLSLSCGPLLCSPLLCLPPLYVFNLGKGVEESGSRRISMERKLSIIPSWWANAKALPGANRLIKHLRKNGVPMALASNSCHDYIEAKISHHKGCFLLDS